MSNDTSQHTFTDAKTADVLVVFGITGDLAKVMTFHSLYRLEERKLLDCPIVGVAVDDWTVDQLRDHARQCIEDTGQAVDKTVFDRFAERLSYVQGDFSDAAVYGRVAAVTKGKDTPVFYLEIPPFLFGTVVKGLSDAGLTTGARVVVEKPFGHDLESARQLAAELHQYIDESQLFRIDHYLGKMGLSRSCNCDSRTRCSNRSGTGTTSRACRSRWQRLSGSRIAGTSTIRSVRCAMSSSIT